MLIYQSNSIFFDFLLIHFIMQIQRKSIGKRLFCTFHLFQRLLLIK